MPTPHHVTMQEVAQAAGVHPSTVSLALRNDPRLPEATRKKIQALATQLGYRPDPMLGALNSYRISGQAVKNPPTMAFLFNLNDASELAEKYPDMYPRRNFLEGAQAQAALLGYHLEVFYVGHEAKAGLRMQHILQARGITGIILGVFVDLSTECHLDWSQFSVVAIESQQLRLPLHTISNHQLAITRKAIRELSELGFQRIGLAAGKDDELYLKNAFTAGYYAEISITPHLAFIPPLVFHGNIPAEIALEIGPWAQAHQVEVVISNWNNIPAALQLANLHPGKEVAVASLDVIPHSGGVTAGIRQNHRIVGERAVEQLASLMRSHVRGLIEVPNTTLIEGEWGDPDQLLRRAAPKIRAATQGLNADRRRKPEHWTFPRS